MGIKIVKELIIGKNVSESGSAGSYVPQLSTLPESSASNEGMIAQYKGATTSSLTNGFFYKSTMHVVSEAVVERMEVSQTAGESLGTMTTDVNVFKAALNPTRTWTYQFSCVGYPKEITLSKFSNGFQFATFTRETAFDNNTLHIYCWVDGSNNFFFTNTRVPNEETIFYVGSTDQIGTPTNENSGWEYTATSTRDTVGFGMWRVGGTDASIDLSDYGIYVPSAGIIGDVLSVTYYYPADEVDSYSWDNITVQINVDDYLKTVSGYDSTKPQSLQHDTTGFKWVDNQ